MNNIEILEQLEKMQQTFMEDGLQGYEMAIVTAKNLINRLIQENKELRIQISARETVVDKLAKENKELNNKRKDGTLSDGYHTYNDLYYQRCVLFAAICNLNKDKSWKSKKHSDGKKCFDSDNWFIVGIDTPEGSYTYHYEMKYWDMFNVKELEVGKIWDGHTEKDVTRLLTLEEGE